jgi:hypothetical protein
VRIIFWFFRRLTIRLAHDQRRRQQQCSTQQDSCSCCERREGRLLTIVILNDQTCRGNRETARTQIFHEWLGGFRTLASERRQGRIDWPVWREKRDKVT